jgi:pyruvate dehydrogenase E1 component
MAEDRRDVGLLAITSADRLYAGARESGLVHSRSHIEWLLAGWVPRRAPYEIPRHFGRTGSLVDLYRHYGIGAYAIVTAAQSLVTGRPIRHLRAL